MWQFAAGLFLVHLEGTGSLRLAAIFGFLASLAVIIFGGAIGTWIDYTPRLKAAKTALIIQNLSVGLCSLVFCLVSYYWTYLKTTWGGLVILGQVLIIVIAVISTLASLASALIIEKDWIIEISGRDHKELAKLNAAFRRIDLTSLVTAPMAVGQIMTYTSMPIAAIFLAGWNLLSVFAELWLLWEIYKCTPALQGTKKGESMESKDEKEFDAVKNDKMTQQVEVTTNDVIKVSKNQEKRDGFQLKKQLSAYGYAWKLYFHQKILFAGLGLSCLYMTVLGFCSISVGYAFIQGISEAFMGWMSGVSGIFGIGGTLVYPHLRKKLGLPKSGLIGLTLLVASLSLCVVSIWAPGSPFNPYFAENGDIDTNQTLQKSNETVAVPSSQNGKRYESIGLFLAGVIIARFGLWISDLTINQIFQENVSDTDRGKVNGVQKSLEEGMNLLKFVLVIVAPRSETFGILIILSFIFICIGLALFAIYARHLCGCFKEKSRSVDQETHGDKGSPISGSCNPAATFEEFS